MDNILQGIIRSEEEALKLESEAKQQALIILAEARKKASEILEKSLLEGEVLSEELLRKAETEAVREAALQQGAKVEIQEQIRSRAKEKLEKTVEYIVGRVVNQSWQ